MSVTRISMQDSYQTAIVRFADSMVCEHRVPGVHCAHPGLYAHVRFADFFRPFINN